MRRIFGFTVLTAIAILFCSVFAYQQKKPAEDSSDNLLLVEFSKSDYVLLEPVLARFKYKYAIGREPDISKQVSVRVTFNGSDKSREYKGLTSSLTQGVPQPLPNNNNSPSPYNRETPEFFDYEEEVIIDRASEFFRAPGTYQIQFFLNSPDGGKVTSNLVEIEVKEPTGSDKEAYEFLSQLEDGISFKWVWNKTNGFSHLEEFVDRFGGTVYGAIAIRYLGNAYFAKGQFDKAGDEFKKIKSSENPVIARDANLALEELAKRNKSKP